MAVKLGPCSTFPPCVPQECSTPRRVMNIGRIVSAWFRGPVSVIFLLLSTSLWWLQLPTYRLQLLAIRFRMFAVASVLRNFVAFCQFIWSFSLQLVLGISVRSTVPPRGERSPDPVIYIFNHRSNSDPWTAGLLAWGARYAFKSELLVVFPMAVFLNHMVVFRKSVEGRAAALEKARMNILLGDSVAMAPEGTRNADPSTPLLEFKLGAFRLSCETRRPIVPLAIFHAEKVWPKERWFPDVGIVHIRQLPAVEPLPGEAPLDLCNRVRAIFLDELKRGPAFVTPSTRMKVLLHLPALAIWLMAITAFVVFLW